MFLSLILSPTLAIETCSDKVISWISLISFGIIASIVSGIEIENSIYLEQNMLKNMYL